MKTVRMVLMPALLALVLAGCAGTVTAPEPGPDHRPVFLVDHGRHSSLVLSRDDESLVRYVYGDWRWYAKRETGFLRAFPTLFSRTQAAFGRGELEGPPEEEVVRQRLRVMIEKIHSLSAPASRIDGLIETLDGRFEAGLETRFYNPDFDLEFVQDPMPYTLGNNSNHEVARWLEELGIEVRGNPMIGRWRLSH